MTSRSRLYVGNISSQTRVSDVRAEFERFGSLRDCVVKSGFAFVEFTDERDASDAIKELDRIRMHGREWQVEYTRRRGREGREDYEDRDRGRDDRGRGRPRGGRRGDRSGHDDSRRRAGFDSDSRRRAGMRPSRGKHRVEVFGISSTTSWQDLKDWGRKAGRSVMYGDIIREGGRKIGVIEYDEEKHHENALQVLHRSKLHGKTVFVYDDGKGPSRTPDSYSRSRSGSRSRSKSKSKDRKSRSRSYSRSKDARSRSPRSSASKSPPPKPDHSPRKASASKSKSKERD